MELGPQPGELGEEPSELGGVGGDAPRLPGHRPGAVVEPLTHELLDLGQRLLQDCLVLGGPERRGDPRACGQEGHQSHGGKPRQVPCHSAPARVPTIFLPTMFLLRGRPRPFSRPRLQLLRERSDLGGKWHVELILQEKLVDSGVLQRPRHVSG